MARLHADEPDGSAAHQSVYLRDRMIRHRDGGRLMADAMKCSDADSKIITFMRAEPGIQERLWCLCIVPDRTTR